MKLRVAALQAGAGVPGGLHKEHWVWTDNFLVTPFSMQDLTCTHTKLLQSLPTLWAQGLGAARLLCPRDSPGKNTGAGCHALLQGIFPTQGLNPGLLHCGHILHHLSLRWTQNLSLQENTAVQKRHVWNHHIVYKQMLPKESLKSINVEELWHTSWQNDYWVVLNEAACGLGRTEGWE